MNSRQLLVVVVLALIAGAAGWMLHSPPAPEKTAEVSAPAAPTTIPTIKAPPAQVAAPTLPPAPKSVAPTASAVATMAQAQTSAPTDPGQLTSQPAPPELVSAISDMTNIIQSGDFVALVENYMPPQQMAALTPEQKTFLESQIQQQISTPQGQQQVKLMTQMAQALPNLTPMINSAGDHATYQVPTPDGAAPAGTPLPPTLPITFVKVDGKWYFNNGGL